MKELKVEHSEEDVRLDKYLRRLLPQAAGGFLYRMLRKKNITLNGRRASGSERLKPGDVIRVFFSDETFYRLSGEGLYDEQLERIKALHSGIEAVYEDTDIIALNKPVGMLTQKAAHDDISLNEHLASYLMDRGSLTGSDYNHFKPSAANRLDRGTSGIVLCSKTPFGARKLSGWIAQKEIHKEYRCIVHGRLKDEGAVVSYLKKDEAANMVSIYDSPADDAARIETIYKIMGEYGDYSELSAVLVTGKSHQIRAQLAHMGCPIVLDRKYGNKKLDTGLYPLYEGQLLHAYRVGLPGGISITAECPQIFLRFK